MAASASSRYRSIVAARDPQRALPGEGDAGEDEGRARVPDRRVGQWVEPVVEDVLRDGEVERPEADRREQHQIGGRAAHGGRTLPAHIPRSRERRSPRKPTSRRCLCAPSVGSCLPSLPVRRSASRLPCPGPIRHRSRPRRPTRPQRRRRSPSRRPAVGSSPPWVSTPGADRALVCVPCRQPKEARSRLMARVLPPPAQLMSPSTRRTSATCGSSHSRA